VNIPGQVSQAWLQGVVPSLTGEELEELLDTLRSRGWSESELSDRVLSLRPANVATATENVAPGAAETVLEPSGSRGAPPTVVERSVSEASGRPPQPESELAIGAEFGGYVIEGVAGRGGMGVVYRARQLRPSRSVALKVISAELASSAGFRERFAHESEIAASIEHSNVIPVYEVGEARELLFLAMRYVEGTDLQATIAAEGRVAPSRAIRIFTQVTAALDAAHAQGLVHRDIKPANVLIAREGGHEHVYLTDFGLAKHAASPGMTRTGFFVGTIDYAAPEQFEGGRIDARTDVYAAGCLLYHMLTGEVPFPAENDAAKMFAHLRKQPPSITTVDPGLPQDVDRVIARAMAKRPEERFPSAGDLGLAAAAARKGESVAHAERNVASGEAAPVSTTGGPAERSPRRGRSLAALGGVGGVVAVAGVAVALSTAGGAKHTPRPTTVQTNQLAACLHNHGLASASLVRRPQSGETQISRAANVAYFQQQTYATCTWPPAIGANPDGYRAITVTQEPGPGATTASGVDVADRIEAPCQAVQLAYSFGSQGAFTRIPAFRAAAGTLWAYQPSGRTGTFAPASPIGTQLPFYPLRNEVDILHNDNTRLDTVSCVA
jgi:predicted Ser/Thr protein kinase